ncbi:PTS galactitol transporter subunit IIB [Escherichia coli]|nr:PTS galactitol transporter subunit IIB [Escherichia coli]
MKKILVVCGNGIASSSIMVSVLQDFLKEEKIEAQVDKSSLMACTSDTFNSYDLVVSSTKLDNPAMVMLPTY